MTRWWMTLTLTMMRITIPTYWKLRMPLILSLLARCPRAEWVDPNGGGTHTDLYSAASWASNNDIILVQPGTYTGCENTGFTLYGALLVSSGGAPHHCNRR